MDGKTYHFRLGGVYNGMFFLIDDETRSTWEHITGECIDGRHRGTQLPYVASPLHMTAASALQRHPDLQLALSKPGLRQRLFNNTLWRGLRRDNNPDGLLPPHFPRSMDTEDPRLARMEMGLGLWAGDQARFYPMTSLREAGNVLIDRFPAEDGRQVVVYIDPQTAAPEAVYVPATACAWDGDALRLSADGNEIGVVEQGEVRISGAGDLEVYRPKQLFTRWYGFAFTFPGCSIFGEAGTAQ